MAKRYGVRLLAAGLVLLAAGCPGGEPAPAGGGPRTAAALSIAVGGDEGTLTPYTYTTGYPGYHLMTLVFDTLLVLDPDNRVRLLLASGLNRNADSTVFTLPLRTGVTWHDGEPFTADDVLFTVDYHRRHGTARFADPLSTVTGVEARDGGVVFTLSEPDPEFPMRSLATMPVLAKHVWSGITDPERAPRSATVGTGPYRLTGYEPGRRYELTANPAYPLGRPRVDRVTVSVVPERQTALAALRTGEVHLVDEVPPSLTARLAGQPGVGVSTGSNFSSTLLLFNNGKAPFDRVEVRRAISAAIDVDDLVTTVLSGQGTAGSPGFWHPDALGAQVTMRHTHDPAAATAALDALGAAPGPDGVRVLDGKPLAFDLLVHAGSPDRVRAAGLITGMLGEVGVKTTVRPMDAGSVDAKVWPDFDLAMWGLPATTMTDFTTLASLVATDATVGRLNVTGIRDTELDAAAGRLMATTRVDTRMVAAARLQELYARKVPFVTLYYPVTAYGYRTDTYAGWAYQRGWGPLNKHSFITVPG